MNKIVLILYISLLIFSSTTSASKLFSDSEINEMISEVASNYSKNLPQTLDQTTILEGVFAGGNRNIVYKYKLILDNFDSTILQEFKRLVYRKHKNNFCTQPNLAFYRTQRITMEHNFMDNFGNYLFSIKLNKSDCN
tara:strand:- start:4226 stop:4636 length:411 start_codon:yes stop_codon:yes gene_type:complete